MIGGDRKLIHRFLADAAGRLLAASIFYVLIALFIAIATLCVYMAYVRYKKHVHVRATYVRMSVLLLLLTTATILFYAGDLYRDAGWTWLQMVGPVGVAGAILLALLLLWITLKIHPLLDKFIDF